MACQTAPGSFVLTQTQIDRERGKQREAALSKLHPIARFLLPAPRPPTVEKDEKPPPR